jgi:two-component system, OmpR family, KDP operon response regulator KdpE
VRVLVVEDEAPALRALTMNLAARGWDVEEATTGAAALDAVAAGPPDIIILDLGLPDMDGLAVIEGVRRRSTVPILVLSARTSSSDKIAALNLGADDYVIKPFSMDELVARLRASTRRSAHLEHAVITLGPSTIDLDAKTVRRLSTEQVTVDVHLTPNEWSILEILLRQPNKLIASRDLLITLRGTPDYTDPSYLRIYVGQLRRKLEAEPGRPRHLLTEPGMGYRYQP